MAAAVAAHTEAESPKPGQKFNFKMCTTDVRMCTHWCKMSRYGDGQRNKKIM